MQTRPVTKWIAAHSRLLLWPCLTLARWHAGNGRFRPRSPPAGRPLAARPVPARGSGSLPPALRLGARRAGEGASASTAAGPKAPRPPSSIQGAHWVEHPEYRRWKDTEEEILKDIEPIKIRTKEILHSNRYMDGERLSAEDEKEVVEKLLVYHPHSEDKIGCGLDSIMVDRHPQFRNSRCLFVVRTDGGWIDFSYQKCLRAYIKQKYPLHAERFIREHFKRS